MTQSRKSGSDKQRIKRETEKENMSKRGVKNAEKSNIGKKGQTDWRKKTKTSNNEIKSKQRQIWGETDEWGNDLIYHVKLKERTE